MKEPVVLGMDDAIMEALRTGLLKVVGSKVLGPRRNELKDHFTFTLNKKVYGTRVSKVIWMKHKGPPPAKAQVCCKKDCEPFIENLYLFTPGNGEKNDRNKGNCSLTDEQVSKLRQEYRNKPFNMSEKAEQLGIGATVLSAAVMGRTYTHVATPPIKKEEFVRFRRISDNTHARQVLTFEQVADLRREYRDKPFNIGAKAKDLEVSVNCLSKALMGKTYQTVQEPAVITKAVHADRNPLNEDLVTKLRKEYKAESFSVTAKAAEIGVAKSTLRLALIGASFTDIAETPVVLSYTRPKKEYKNTPPSNRKLSDEQVAELRREYRVKPFSVKEKADKLNLAKNSLCAALKGVTYKAVNEVSQPVTLVSGPTIRKTKGRRMFVPVVEPTAPRAAVRNKEERVIVRKIRNGGLGRANHRQSLLNRYNRLTENNEYALENYRGSGDPERLSVIRAVAERMKEDGRL